MQEWLREGLRKQHNITKIVTADTTTAELAREINRHPGFKAVSWGRHGIRRVYITRFRYVNTESGIDDTVKPEYRIYIVFPPLHLQLAEEPLWREFGRGFVPRDEPVLTVLEADMQKGPQIECMMVGEALARIGIDVAIKTAPSSELRRNIDYLQFDSQT